MELEGRWTGVLYIEKLREFIPDEFFQIDILSVDENNTIAVRVWERIKATDSLDPSSGGKTKIMDYRGEGEYNPESFRFRLVYEATDFSEFPQSVELTGILREDCRMMEGQYRLLSGPCPSAAFTLWKTEGEPL